MPNANSQATAMFRWCGGLAAILAKSQPKRE
jgi:hypothetical protein